MQEKQITAEQWDRIENSMRKFEEYGKKVQEYLLFLMGGMRELSEREQTKSFNEAPEKIKQLEEELHSTEIDIIFRQFIFRDGEFENVKLDEAAEKRRAEMHWKYTVIYSHVRHWLDAAATFLRDFNRMTEKEAIEWIKRIYIDTNQPDKCIALRMAIAALSDVQKYRANCEGCKNVNTDECLHCMRAYSDCYYGDRKRNNL